MSSSCHWLWLPKLVEHTMFDTKVTLRLSVYCNFCWFLQVKLNFSASQVTFIVMASSIASTMSNYFWVYCKQMKRSFNANFGEPSVKIFRLRALDKIKFFFLAFYGWKTKTKKNKKIRTTEWTEQFKCTNRCTVENCSL